MSWGWHEDDNTYVMKIVVTYVNLKNKYAKLCVKHSECKILYFINQINTILHLHVTNNLHGSSYQFDYIVKTLIANISIPTQLKLIIS